MLHNIGKYNLEILEKSDFETFAILSHSKCARFFSKRRTCPLLFTIGTTDVEALEIIFKILLSKQNKRNKNVDRRKEGDTIRKKMKVGTNR